MLLASVLGSMFVKVFNVISSMGEGNSRWFESLLAKLVRVSAVNNVCVQF